MVIAEWVGDGSKEYKEADGESSCYFVTPVHVLHSPQGQNPPNEIKARLPQLVILVQVLRAAESQNIVKF